MRPRLGRPASLLALSLLPVFVRCGGDRALAPSPDLVVVETERLPAAATGLLYETRLLGRGPHPPLTWRTVAGVLPRGLSLDGETGTIAGWPRRPGTYRVTVEARDGVDGGLARDVVFAAARRALDLEVARGPLAVLPLEVPPAQFGAPYSHRLEAAGGTEPYRYEALEGTLPPGLVLDRDGALVGVPTEARSPYAPRVRVTDATGAVAERTIALRVVVLPLGIAPPGLPDAALGFPYDRSLSVTPGGGGPPYAWAVRPFAQALPPGLALDASTGHVAGAATALGTFAFRLEVSDAAGQTASRDVSIVVNPGPVLEAVTPGTPPKSRGPVRLRGQAFQPGMTATFGAETPVETTWLDATTATAIPPTFLRQSGSVAVRVTNPDGGTHVRSGLFRYPLSTVAFRYEGVKGVPGSLGSSRGIAAGDLDGDGRAEIVQVWSSGIQIVRSTGAAYDGSWAAANVRTSGSYDDVGLADVDADGDLDLVVLRSSSTETIETYRNDGHGGFPATASATTTYPKPSSLHFPNSLAVGDANGDGVPDVAFTSGRGGQGVLWLYRGLGDGSFVLLHQALDSIHDASHGCFAPNAVALADLDGDGRADLVVTDAYPSACAAGQSCPSTDVANAYPGSDLLVAWVARAGPTGAPTGWEPVTVSGQGGRLDGDNVGLAVYDHDGDGRTDLAVFGGFRDVRGMGVSFLTGDGRGGFVERLTRPTAYDRRYGARIDANQDGCADLLVVGGDGRAGSFGALGYSVAEVYLGGDGEVPVRAWATGPDLTVGGIPSSNPGRVAVADFDGDGLEDFAVDQSFNSKERFSNDQDDGPVEGVAVYLNRSH